MKKKYPSFPRFSSIVFFCWEKMYTGFRLVGLAMNNASSFNALGHDGLVLGLLARTVVFLSFLLTCFSLLWCLSLFLVLESGLIKEQHTLNLIRWMEWESARLGPSACMLVPSPGKPRWGLVPYYVCSIRSWHKRKMS